MSDQPQEPPSVPPADPSTPSPAPGYGPPPPAPGYGPPPPAPGYGPPPPAPGYGPPSAGYGPPPPGYGPAPAYPQGYAGGPPPPSNGLAIGALIVAIVALLACWIPYVGVPLPVVALVLALLGLRKARSVGAGKGIAVAGLVIGFVALLIALFVTVVVTIFFHNHRNILNCGSSSLTPAQQQQCIRSELGLPSAAPS